MLWKSYKEELHVYIAKRSGKMHIYGLKCGPLLPLFLIDKFHSSFHNCHFALFDIDELFLMSIEDTIIHILLYAMHNNVMLFVICMICKICMLYYFILIDYNCFWVPNKYQLKENLWCSESIQILLLRGFIKSFFSFFPQFTEHPTPV